jgi:hypothetical protein
VKQTVAIKNIAALRGMWPSVSARRHMLWTAAKYPTLGQERIF